MFYFLSESWRIDKYIYSDINYLFLYQIQNSRNVLFLYYFFITIFIYIYIYIYIYISRDHHLRELIPHNSLSPYDNLRRFIFRLKNYFYPVIRLVICVTCYICICHIQLRKLFQDVGRACVYPEFENRCKIAKTGKERHRRKWIWLVLTDEEFTEEESVVDDCFFKLPLHSDCSDTDDFLTKRHLHS